MKDPSLLKMVFIKAPFNLFGSGFCCALFCVVIPRVCVSVSFVAPAVGSNTAKLNQNSTPFCFKNARVCVCVVRDATQLCSSGANLTPCCV